MCKWILETVLIYYSKNMNTNTSEMYNLNRTKTLISYKYEILFSLN
jgi:hypothetical protein